MSKSLKSNSYRFVVVLLLLLTFLTTGMVGKVITSYALAQEITPELEPVYDTEVVSLKDYVDNVLTDAQVAIFNTILGSYVASQAGLNEYDIEYPYNDRTGVIGWLQDAGMKLYNAIITGGSFDLVTGTDLRTYIITAASYAIGMAQKAHTYTDIDDFLDDVDNSTHYFVPIDPILQASINSYFGRDYGLWNWQFQTEPFESNFNWSSYTMSGVQQTEYDGYLLNYDPPYVKCNRVTGMYFFLNYKASSVIFSDYTNLFVDTDDHVFILYNNNNQPLLKENIDFVYYFYSGSYPSNGYVGTSSEINTSVFTKFDTRNGYSYESYTAGQFTTYKDLVQAFFDNDTRIISQYNTYHYCWSDFIEHVYVGENWANKQELFNVGDLNFSQNDSPSYNQVPDNSYIDLKGFLTDIVNNTNILNVILNNLFKPDGTLNIDPALIKVSITIPDTNPLPINLNEIQLYTDNEYLDVVKQRSLQASETIGEYVAFWHNCDSELVYAILGSFIVILIGAFIGKWGHS